MVKIKYNAAEPTIYQGFGIAAGRVKQFIAWLEAKGPYHTKDMVPEVKAYAKTPEEFAYFCFFLGTVEGRTTTLNEITTGKIQ